MHTASRIQRRPRVRRMTLEEYLSGAPDEFKAELIDGEVVMSPSPADWHQDLQADLGHILRRWVRAQALGWIWHDLDMILDEDRALVYRPDLLFLATEHQHRRKRRRIFGPADLCVEILSPSDRPLVQRRKYAHYARYGVCWYWIITAGDEEPTLEENELVRGEYVVRNEIAGNAWFEPSIFPGLHFRLPPLLEGDLKAAVKGKAKKLI